MKRGKSKINTLNLTREKRLENLHYRIFVLFAVLTILYYIFFEPETVGHDSRYTIFVFWLPTVFGVLILAWYRRKTLLQDFSLRGKWWEKIILFLFQSAIGFLFSFISFGLVARVVFDRLNLAETKHHRPRQVVCPIEDLRTRRGSSIYFRFNNRMESFRVSYKSIKEYKDIDPADLKLSLRVRKGIWDYYVVEGWEIVE